MNNQLIADGWIYPDLAHVDAEGEKASTLILPYEERYFATTSNCCALAMKVTGLLALITDLSKGIDFGVSEDVWTKQVVYDGGQHKVVASRIFFGEPGTEIPEGDITKAKGFTELTPTIFISTISPRNKAPFCIVDIHGHTLRQLQGICVSDQGKLLLTIDDLIMIAVENVGRVSAAHPRILSTRTTKKHEQEAKELPDL